MLDLTFGEQVKIILSRKGMTIKELAEMIEERTGKKMSRQNLTQRLGRDNFQEQDMRMIAEILGCPFQLNILGDARQPENTDEESVHVTEAELLRLEKKKGKKHRHPVERDITIGELVDLNSGLDQLLEEKEELLGEEIALDAARPEQEDAAEAVVAEERVTEASVAEEQTEEPAASVEAASEEAMPEDAAPEEMAAEATVEEIVEEVPAEETPQERPAKKARGSWRDFFQRRTRKEPKEHVAQTEAERQAASPAAAREDVKLQEEPEEVPDEALETAAEETLEERAAETPVYTQETREEMLQAGGDEEEDLEKGEVNPYTGHEYESNTVRMHPKRIGYVQVYDRSSHQWTDMTEWAFLGYQERKKALLGNDYEPPIYLD
ncbi:hypothetical protein [Eubacterium sp. ER2]|uniref:hypothetical protein n=1 Tax=Eubacterium sp. ER2 TaxID=1519438 RepID=UPI00051AD06D|nr:hypothetical protein [Eubacterium sp. ER2]